MTPYQRLANAIVEQAAKDYRSALKALARDSDNAYIQDEVKSLERFFRSRWYGILTNVDGDYLIDKLREEAKM
ncbi:MAG: hypothetical protein PUK18_12515 [Firmicutes bacterium]|nr:hypothetical protein [Bacillota bacterium]MDY6160275.1 hypothetical protein [Candidatus Faecousia sp.]